MSTNPSPIEEAIRQWREFADANRQVVSIELVRSRRLWRGVGKQTWLCKAILSDNRMLSAIHDHDPAAAIASVLNQCAMALRKKP